MDLYSQASFSPIELEFMAEAELIGVRPLASLDALQLLSGNCGPLVADVRADVPIWLALALKSSGKVRVVVPDWLRAGALKSLANIAADVQRLVCSQNRSTSPESVGNPRVQNNPSIVGIRVVTNVTRGVGRLTL
jgi:hypothetical protein